MLVAGAVSSGGPEFDAVRWEEHFALLWWDFGSKGRALSEQDSKQQRSGFREMLAQQHASVCLHLSGKRKAGG